MGSGLSDYATYLEEQMKPGGSIYEALHAYSEDLNNISSESGLNWEDMTASIDDYDEAVAHAQDGMTEINNTLQETLYNINDTTDAWVAHAEILNALIEEYEELANAAAGAIKQVAGTDTMIDTAI